MEKSTQQPTVFDTNLQQLGEVYAKALLGVGAESGKVDQLVDQLSEVTNVVGAIKGFSDALSSPRVDAAAKVGLVDKAFNGKVDPSLLNFLKVLAQKGRFDCLEAATAAANKLRDDAAGRVQAVLTTAAEVDSSVCDRIAEKLAGVIGKKVSLSTEIDPDVIGGMVVRVGDTVYDGSVVNQLAQVKAKAVENAANAIREKLDRFASSN